ncbi:MAG: flavodoxin [Bacteroidales bacterium]|jgi:flavodoxin I|nr:flavodoxin [Bacteroidales bacterium]
MKPISIFYGSTSGNTRKIAENIKANLEPGLVKIFDVKYAKIEDIEMYENIILGTSTWGEGILQADFEKFLINILVKANLKGKKIAIFGTGDSSLYPKSFADSMGIIFEALEGKGVIFVGEFPTDGYQFISSLSMFGDKFVGLPLDDNSDEEQNKLRMSIWTELLKSSLN